jgi:hypothetical protein
MEQSKLEREGQGQRAHTAGALPRRRALWIVLTLGLAVVVRQPAYANGEHMHLGGIFFLFLGGGIFIAGLGLVLYFLLRRDTAERLEDTEENELE